MSVQLHPGQSVLVHNFAHHQPVFYSPRSPNEEGFTLQNETLMGYFSHTSNTSNTFFLFLFISFFQVGWIMQTS
jgi:hypothetical protein